MNSSEVLITFKGNIDGVEDATKKMQKELERLKKVGEVALTGITTALDKMTVSFLKAGIEYDAQIETYLTRLTTLTGSFEEANKILEQIKKDALKTPFDVSSLTQAESLLLSTGLTAEEAREDILALGDAISASGGGNAELQRMAVNLQQIKNVGKASALDIKQFAYAGIDIYGLLADSMGVTREEASKLDVTYEMLSTALQKASTKGGKYYKAMEKQSTTYNGAMSNLKESLDVLKGTLAKDLFNAFKKIIPPLTQFIDWLGKNKAIVEAVIVPTLIFFNTLMLFLAVSKIIGIITALGVAITSIPFALPVAILGVIISLIIILWNNCKEFRDFIKVAFNSIINMFKLVWNAIKMYIDFTVKCFEMWKKAFTSIVNKVNEVKQKIIDTFKKIKEGIKQKIEDIINKIKEKIEDFKKAGKDLIGGLWKGITEKWDSLKENVKKFGNGIKDGFKKVFKIKSPSRVFADEIGAYLSEGIVVGFTTDMDKNSKQMLNSLNGAFGLSPTLTGTASTHLSPNVNVVVNNNMKTDPLGQLVNNVKTFSGGAKNDYNYGYGG